MYIANLGARELKKISLSLPLCKGLINKQPAKWVRVGGGGRKGTETIRMTDKDKGKDRNTVYQGKRGE